MLVKCQQINCRENFGGENFSKIDRHLSNSSDFSTVKALR